MQISSDKPAPGKRSYRIAMVAACPFPVPRGTPTRILRMAETLAGRGHDVHVVTYHLGHELANTRLSVHRTAKLPTYNRVSPGPSLQKLLLLDPLLAARLVGVVRRYDIELIHAHHFEGVLSAWPAARLFGKPLIFDAHTLLESELPSYRIGLSARVKIRLGRVLDRYVPRLATSIIAVSDEIKTKLVQRWGIDAGRIAVIPNGVEVELFENGPADRGGREAEVRTLVFAGTLAGYQRVDMLLSVFARVCRARNDVRLVMLTTADFAPYEGLARQLGIRDRIEVVPCDFSELPRRLVRADIGLSPRTECDGLPQKILNYMAAGLPVVASAGSAKHLQHGVHGLVVPDNDEQAFAGAILEILDDPEAARRYGENARAFVKTNLSWERNAQDTERVYETLMCQGRLENVASK